MQQLVEQLSTALREKDLVLATAESCTGGMMSAAMTSIAGSSSVFDRGFVTYSNPAKHEILGISQNILNYYGAVSAQCADAMALGALEHSNADISVSVTGIAGPGGGGEEKPVGLVYIGVAIKGREPKVMEYNFSGSRDDIRRVVCEEAFKKLIEEVHTL
ncbi:MAG: CinA family protein [Alphaproteobacteria bacterium]